MGYYCVTLRAEDLVICRDLNNNKFGSSNQILHSDLTKDEARKISHDLAKKYDVTRKFNEKLSFNSNWIKYEEGTLLEEDEYLIWPRNKGSSVAHFRHKSKDFTFDGWYSGGLPYCGEHGENYVQFYAHLPSEPIWFK